MSLIGGVVGASKLLNFNIKKLLNAMGIAGASCPILAGQKWEDIEGPSIMCKYNAWAGWCAQLATVAALMAEKGFTGDPSIFDGELDFGLISGSGFFKPEILMGNLGKDWHILKSAPKAYPCCRANHSGIQALQKIILENEIKISEIKEIKVMGDLFLLEPNRKALDIENSIDTQFSNAYIFAVAAIYPDFAGPLWQMPILYNRPEIKKLARKIKVEIHPKTYDMLKESAKKGVKITSMTSRAIIPNVLVKVKTEKEEYIGEEFAPKGTINNPMSEIEILDKFKGNSCFSLITQSKIEKSIDLIQNLEKLENLEKLMGLLRIKS